MTMGHDQNLERWIWANIPSPVLIETFEAVGVGTIILDLQHGEATLADILACLRAARGSKIVARIGVKPHPDLINRLLDAGVNAIMFAQINNPEDAATAISYMRYPPDGQRGVAGAVRANRYGCDAEYFRHLIQHGTAIMQIETLESVENAMDIASIKGVDSLFVGTSDLAAAVGRIGDPSHDDVINILARIARERRNDDVTIRLGAYCGASEKLRNACTELQYDFIVVASDTQLLRDGAKFALTP